MKMTVLNTCRIPRHRTLKRFFILFVSIFFLVAPLNTLADTIKGPSSVTAVTVYPDRAVVTRTMSVKLNPGSFDVEFGGLPMGLFEDSIKVFAKGTASAKVTGLELKKTFLKDIEDPRIKALTEELEGLKDKNRVLVDHKKNLALQRKFIESIQVKASQDITKDIEHARVRVDEWQGLLKFYLDNLEKIDGEIRITEIEGRKIADKINALQKELNALKPRKPRGERSAVAGLEVTEPGDLSIELTYAITGAWWRPSYDVRVTGDSKKVGITYYGEVRQKTGEAWDSVEVTLSTARPAIGAQVPKLPPWYVVVPVLRDEEKRKRALKKKEAGKAGLSKAAEMAEAPSEAEPLTAEAEKGFTSSTFRIPGKADIPSDGAPHKGVIAVEELEADFEHETVPKLLELAFLKGDVKNTTGKHMLAGNVNVYVGGDFIGTSRIKTVAPDESFNLSLGIDEGIKVSRKLLKREKGKSGFVSNKVRSLFRFKLEVSNFKKDEVKIDVVDQIPVSQIKEITVKLSEVSVEPDEKTEEGFLRWSLALDPGETKEIIFEFYIEHPKDMNVFGL
jgi:uncharacterized protein (TIGR02231 family)